MYHDEHAAHREAMYSQIGERFETFQRMRAHGAAFRGDDAVVVTHLVLQWDPS